MKFVIIGSGPTALGAAFRLNDLIESGTIPSDTQVVIIEKEDTVGGLARSVTDERGFTWDLGVHVTGATKFHKFSAAINSVVTEWNTIPRCVKAYMSHVVQDVVAANNYVPYPVQNSIPYFCDDVKTKCIDEIEALPQQPRTANFGEFTRDTFGETLQREFIRPYNEKVWTVKLEEMNTSWAANRVPRADVADLRRRCRLTPSELRAEEESREKQCFRYPKNLKGAGEMWRLLANWLPRSWFKFNCQLQKIDVNNQRVYIQNNKFTSYDYVISTMSIVELGQISGVVPELSLKHSKVVLVGIGIRKPQPEATEKLSWLYFHQPDILFYRCTFISNFNERLTPNAALYWSVVCEIGLPADATVDQEFLVQKTIEDLTNHGILEADNEVMHRWVHVLPLGYPIPTLERDVQLRRAHDSLEKHFIYSRGRFGGWKYEVANQDHSFAMGIEIVDRILFNAPETVYQLP